MLIALYDVRSIKFLGHMWHILDNHAQPFVETLQAELISSCPLEKERIIQEFQRNEFQQMLQGARATLNSHLGCITSIEMFNIDVYDDGSLITGVWVPQGLQEIMARVIEELQMEVISVIEIPSESIEIEIPSESIEIEIPSESIEIEIPSVSIEIEIPSESNEM
ncbi:hypothetical protein NPIL_494941 [Nephila pilipes]|uniref:Uncharacterized protein n=1 Tax=Nephila pilipes TaxID=299642 RepID=A0A8X6QT51_NEPPI|nr:hypothetical protein NPIL_494941 [Nephila pilipes]